LLTAPFPQHPAVPVQLPRKNAYKGGWQQYGR
jgi:hypothetical protein